MGSNKLRNPQLHVTMADGAEWVVQVLNMDMLAWEDYAGRKRLTEGHNMTMLTYVSWRAALREGHIPPTVGWDRYSTELAVEVRDPDLVTVDPTPPGPATG
jgi:hypothetical protein